MAVIEFIGDEVSAAGYRLCGIDVRIAERGNVVSLVKQACERASLVLLASSAARTIPASERDKLLASIQPPVLIVSDVRGMQTVPDITGRIYKQLGMLE